MLVELVIKYFVDAFQDRSPAQILKESPVFFHSISTLLVKHLFSSVNESQRVHQKLIVDLDEFCGHVIVKILRGRHFSR